jgi:rod shape-determining protein MreC
MALLGSMERPLYGRGPSAGLRFTMCALVSIALMYLDAHGHLARRLRYGLQAIAYPIQEAVGSPGLAWHWLTQSFESRAALRADNERLRAQLQQLQLQAIREDALERENAELRGLRAALPPLIKHWQLAEIIGVETDPLRQRIILNKGANAGVSPNQAVVDGNGVLGQVARVGPFSSEVILVTDPAHAIPVQVTRNNLRSIAVGNEGELLLPYLASNSDVQSGDLLVTSGLGGVFPAGFPVARIIGVRRDNPQQPAQVRAQPLSSVTRDREVILLQFESDNPDAPASAPPLAPLDAHTPGGARSGASGASGAPRGSHASGPAAGHPTAAPSATHAAPSATHPTAPAAHGAAAAAPAAPAPKTVSHE